MKYGLIAAVVTAAFVGSMAQAETYICKLQPEGHDYGWISKTIAVNIDNKTGKALVNDAIILDIYKVPIEAEVTMNTAKRLTLRWEVSDIKTVRNQIYKRVFYRLVIFKSRGNKAIAKVIPAGYYDNLTSTGKCVLRK